MSNSRTTLDSTAMLLLVILCASWGFQQVTIKVAMEGISPVLQAGIRSFGATIFLFLWMVFRKESIFERDGSLVWGLLAGFLFGSEFLLVYWGLEFTSASRAIIFLYLSPFVVAIGAQFFIPGENLRKIQVVGLVFAFVGIVVAFSESLQLTSSQMLVGDSMVTVAAILWGATTVVIKASPLKTIKPSKTLLYQLAVSGFILPLASLFLGEAGVEKMTPLIFGSIAYQVVWVAAITYLVWFWLIRHYPASHVSSFSFLTPLFGVMAGGLFLNEPMTPFLLAALVLVGTGIYLVNRPAVKVQTVPIEKNRE